MVKSALLTRFRAKLLRPAEGGDWTFVRLPQEASDQMPARSMVSVQGTMNGFTFAATLEPDSYGGHWLKLEPEWTLGASAHVGDELDFEISPASVEPEPKVPEELRRALAASPSALATWNDTSAMARRDWITWMGQVKKAESRQIRLTKMTDMLSHGKRRVCCFDRSGMATKLFVCPAAAEE